MGTPSALGRDTRFVWLLGYLLVYIISSGLAMIVNTVVLGLGDAKFGAGGWLIYWPVWGGMFLPLVFVASFVAEIWWRSTSKRLLQFFGITLLVFLCAMEASFITDMQLPALGLELLLLSVLTVAFASKWFRHGS